MVVLRRPQDIKVSRRRELIHGPRQLSYICVYRIVLDGTRAGYLGRRAILNFLCRNEGIHVARGSDNLAEDAGEIGVARHEIGNPITWLSAREGDQLSRLTLGIELTLLKWPMRIGHRGRYRSGDRAAGFTGDR